MTPRYSLYVLGCLRNKYSTFIGYSGQSRAYRKLSRFSVLQRQHVINNITGKSFRTYARDSIIVELSTQTVGTHQTKDFYMHDVCFWFGFDRRRIIQKGPILAFSSSFRFVLVRATEL